MGTQVGTGVGWLRNAISVEKSRTALEPVKLKRPVVDHCDNCGAEVIRTQTRSAYGLFCSEECLRKYVRKKLEVR